ncbi:coagulation factor IXa [Corythoichthys intestinalis]|uniref:coagulation factor IXa n=1 Tax=Corythoichthys intestinalis TaxID=161448 RepID=UPI0025A59311|nr:coagulation factor IXa [Corythoichthys intestinalis]XP_061793220.1 coagulation factor IX-like [Nerophis lumbriciformis]
MCKHNPCALWSLRLFVMANIFLALVLLSLIHLSLGGSLFLSGKEADGVLSRHKRSNRGFLEEMWQGNLERECYEETCDFEEAREVFEDHDQTVAFWTVYMDGDQCRSNPCFHRARCEDGANSYKCHCPKDFSGINCEIDSLKRCDLNNGDCKHFCQPTGIIGGKCYCAEGYKLMRDGLSCKPQVEFPCGKVAITEKRQRIVGGVEVEKGEIPWQAALVRTSDGKVFCGGSILNERWVVTAAHCLNLDPFYVRLGEHNVTLDEGTEQNIIVSQQYIYPLYDRSVSEYDHDIALLRLQRPVNFSEYVRPICVGPTDFTEALVKRASPATVSGWGQTLYLGLTANTLLKLAAPITSRSECKFTSSARITPAMFCAGYIDQPRDACKGDSGGPHANRIDNTWFLTGIVSWGEKCATDGKYGVYTRLSIYYNWIRNVTHELDAHHENLDELLLWR